ncbi:21641_t:CDS:2, partial [Racocetra persica]
MHGEEYEPMYKKEYELMYEEEHEPIYEKKYEPMYKKAYKLELQLDESEVSESSQVQKSNSSNSTHTRNTSKKKEENYAICEICNQKLVYQHGMILNLKRYLNSHKTKVPELKKLNVKEGISVVNMLNNKSG